MIYCFSDTVLCSLLFHKVGCQNPIKSEAKDKLACGDRKEVYDHGRFGIIKSFIKQAGASWRRGGVAVRFRYKIFMCPFLDCLDLNCLLPIKSRINTDKYKSGSGAVHKCAALPL